MVGLVAVTGLAGAGKTTAVTHLAKLTGGQVFYLGDVVLNEIRARGLPETRENEKHVRIQLRQENGPAALAMPFRDRISENLQKGVPSFIDSIFVLAEFNLVRTWTGDAPAHLLAIDASFDVRLARLKDRPERPFTRDELGDRDKTELETLGTGAVIAAASDRIRNEGSMDDFYARLAEFLKSWSSTPGRFV